MNLIKYDGRTTYMFPNGELATPERVKKDYPATAAFTHVILTDGEVLFSIQNLSAMRSIKGIDPALNEAAAITALNELENAPAPVPEPSAEERIAAAMEYQNLVNM